MPVAGVTVAASRSIKFGTWLEIQGVGKRRVDDRLARRFDDRIDIFFDSHTDALRFGKQKLNVEIVK